MQPPTILTNTNNTNRTNNNSFDSCHSCSELIIRGDNGTHQKPRHERQSTTPRTTASAGTRLCRGLTKEKVPGPDKRKGAGARGVHVPMSIPHAAGTRARSGRSFPNNAHANPPRRRHPGTERSLLSKQRTCEYNTISM